MLRKCLVVAGASIASLVAMPSVGSAATLVYTDSEQGVYIGLPAFDPSLGTLDSVSLTVDASRTRDWFLFAPGNPPSRSLTYDFNAALLLSGPGLAPGTTITLSSAGQQTVSLESAGFETPYFNGSASYGVFTASFSGSATFAGLDPDLFLTTAYGGFDPDPIYFSAFLTGYYDYGPESAGIYGTIDVNGASQLVLLGGSCGGTTYSPPEDWCGTTNYTLTYNYTPSGQVGAVPEPGTWAMMLIGFGAIGFSMRRRASGLLPQTA